VTRIRILRYDRDPNPSGRRGYKNRDVICAAAGEMALDIKDADRYGDFPGQPGMGTLVVEKAPDYHAIIINSMSPDAQRALDDTLVALELHGCGFDRLIYIHGEEGNGTHKELEQKGVCCVRARGGNGHLLPQDAVGVVQAISRLAN